MAITEHRAIAAEQAVAGRRLDSPFAETDFLGRKVPRRLGMPDFLLMVLRWDPRRVRRVPARAIEGESEVEALVACPCGARPVVVSKLERCPGCERFYYFVDLGNVYVAYGAMEPPERGAENGR